MCAFSAWLHAHSLESNSDKLDYIFYTVRISTYAVYICCIFSLFPAYIGAVNECVTKQK